MTRFALLRCSSCEYTFPGRLPPLEEDLPECPLCGSRPERDNTGPATLEEVLARGSVQLLELLEPVRD
jgi:rRNA maturation endonuclease Nob1